MIGSFTKNGVTLTGVWKDGHLKKIKYDNGDKIIGKTDTNGDFWGEGKRNYGYGDVYIGQFLNHTRDGQGKMIYSNQETKSYEGGWANDVYSG